VFRAPVKRTLIPLAGAMITALLVLAAPALSVRPYRPAPVDFEMAAPSGGDVRAARADRGYISPTVRASKRFNLVGMRWRGGEDEPRIAVRVRAAGDRWGRWTPVGSHPDGAPDPGTGEATAAGGVSAPVWSGESDELQYRLSEPVEGLRLHFVNTTGSSTPRDRAVTAVRSAVSSTVAALTTPTSAFAQSGRPTIVPRAAWGADGCRPRSSPGVGQVKLAFVHHTVTATSYTREQAAAQVLAICRYHRNSNGWGDIGYNFLVDRYGTIYEGRAGGVDRAVVGAQAQGWNAQSTGIANLGTFSTQGQTPEAIAAMTRIIRWKLPLHGVPTTGTVRVPSAGGATTRLARGVVGTFNRVSGHRDGNSTSCPGDALFRQLPELRSRVAGAAPSPSAPDAGDEPKVERPGATLARTATRVNVGRLIRVRGTLRPAGTRVTVAVERRGGGGSSRRVATLRTRVSGTTFAAYYRPKLRGLYRFRAVVAGSSSGPVHVRAVSGAGGGGAGAR
jgi:uncharacterized protein with LGFP repeats